MVGLSLFIASAKAPYSSPQCSANRFRMPLALILSSHVAGSRVGGSAQAAALVQFKVDSFVVPTVLYGRHPGWGAPGGAAGA